MADPTPDDGPDLEAEFVRLLAGFIDDVLDPEGVARLDDLLRGDDDRRRLIVDACLQRQFLPDALGVSDPPVNALPRGQTTREAVPRWRSAAVLTGLAALLLVGVVVGVRFRGGADGDRADPAPPAVVARLRATENCRWVDPAFSPADGAVLTAGARLELASGRAELVFGCGAEVTLLGPAIFVTETDNSGVLTLGKASARAATPAARGFTIRSRTATVVDLGTEFDLVAAADGHTQVAVVSGAVEVLLPGDRRHRVNEGEALGVEPGRPGVTAKAEGGEGGPEFRLPTIEPPSAHDYADASRGRAVVRVLRGSLDSKSGAVGLLLDGRGQSNPDAPSESVFLERNTAGLILLDLGRAARVRKVNTYSWHRDRLAPANRVRATQRYVLYGAPDGPVPATDGDPAGRGWVVIARVDSDESLGVSTPRLRPAQQAVSVAAARGVLGEYRYLLWEVRPTPSEAPAIQDHAFYGEFDVYAD